MLTSGFFDSYDGDRKYNALDMSSIFDGIINEGVYASIGDRFTLSIKSGLKILVGSGRAWLNHTWTLNDAPYEIDLSSFAKTDPLKEKVVSILLKVDMRQIKGSNADPARITEIVAVSGGSADVGKAKPIEIKNPYNVGFEKLNGTDSPYAIYYYRLGNITLTPNITTLSNINIVQTVGRTDLDGPPFVSGILQVLSLDVWWENWEAQFSKFLGDSQSRFDNFMAAISTSFNQKMESFDNTFLSNLNKWNTTFNQKMDNIDSEFSSKMTEIDDTFATKMNQWNTTFTNNMNEWGSAFSSKQLELENLLTNFNQFVTTSKNDFNTWFASIQDLISGTGIEDLEKRVKALEDEMAEGGGGADISELEKKVKDNEEGIERIFELIDTKQIQSDPTNQAMVNIKRYMEVNNCTFKEALDFCNGHGLIAYIPREETYELTTAYDLYCNIVMAPEACLRVKNTLTIHSNVTIHGGILKLTATAANQCIRVMANVVIEDCQIIYEESTNVLTTPIFMESSNASPEGWYSLDLRNCLILINNGGRHLIWIRNYFEFTMDQCEIIYTGAQPLIGPTTNKHPGVIIIYDDVSRRDQAINLTDCSFDLQPKGNVYTDLITTYKNDGGANHTNLDIIIDNCRIFDVNWMVVVCDAELVSITNCYLRNGGMLNGGGWNHLKLLGNNSYLTLDNLVSDSYTLLVTKGFGSYIVANNTGLQVGHTNGYYNIAEPNGNGFLSGNVILCWTQDGVLNFKDVFVNDITNGFVSPTNRVQVHY